MKNRLEKPLTLAMKNGETVPMADIPLLSYGEFYQQVSDLLADEHGHCVTYYGCQYRGHLRLLCAIANDHRRTIEVLSYELPVAGPHRLPSLAAKFFPLHGFEREIWENWGVEFTNHPWLKPIRFPWDRANQQRQVNDYPFYAIESEQLHEVGVGPIHAGVIEPGHFRFICNGEMVLHLEIQLGWQHRGIEHLFVQKKKLLERTTLAENIAGDTAVGHNLTFVNLMESMAGLEARHDPRLQYERAIALELERIAMHDFDLSNLSTGLAYQLGAAVFGVLRTPLINYFQWWCGNRFAKSLVRTGGSHYPLDASLINRMKVMFEDYSVKFAEMADKTFSMPSVLERVENIGTVTKKQVELIGAVGLSARMSGVLRDVRHSHPTGAYADHPYRIATAHSGDVLARMQVRRVEIEKSVAYISALLPKLPALPVSPKPVYRVVLPPNSFGLSLTEGWRGEICHSALTDEHGEICHYKVKDPSFHNWMALALALRNTEISDFPINNKSFDLSYCGHDL